MTTAILDSLIAYFAALGLFAVLWTVCGRILGYWRWFVDRRSNGSADRNG
ncbi:MAG: hypothetical protein FWG36_04015 [Oscillospiraceae bacterium]|nr:hypothetical protein [Oscillospiraceae bacterium]